MITIRLRVLGLQIAEVTLEGRDDIEDEFRLLERETEAEETE